MIGQDELKKRFTWHSPKGDQTARYQAIRERALGWAMFVDANCPDSREKSLAMTAMEEAVFWANAAIARNE